MSTWYEGKYNMKQYHSEIKKEATEKQTAPEYTMACVPLVTIYSLAKKNIEHQRKTWQSKQKKQRKQMANRETYELVLVWWYLYNKTMLPGAFFFFFLKFHTQEGNHSISGEVNDREIMLLTKLLP